jgi:hypothetical protein
LTLADDLPCSYMNRQPSFRRKRPAETVWTGV